MKLLILFALIFYQPASFSNELRAALGQVLDNADTVIEQHRQRTANDQARLYYEGQVAAKPCTHCPEYLKTIHQVNLIVEELTKNPSSDIQLHNRALTEVNRLKFQYYETRHLNEQGEVICDVHRHHDPINRQPFGADRIHLLAERALSLNDVTDFAIYPMGKNREQRYFYRGEGAQNHILIEIVVRSDQSALIRYHSYNDPLTQNLPFLGSDRQLQRLDNGKTEHRIHDDVHLSHKQQLGLSQQSTQASLTIDQRDWVQVETRHNTAKNIELQTVVPVKLEIGESDYSLSGSYRAGQTLEYASESIDQTQQQVVTLGLTDHNHEYLRVTQINRQQIEKVTGHVRETESLSLSSRYNLGDYGQIGASITEDQRGERTQQFSHTLSGENSRTTTSLVQTDRGNHLELTRSQQLNQTTTASMTLRSNDKSLSTLLFQVEMKF